MNTTTKRYRWSHPSEWLEEYISEVAGRNDVETLCQIAQELTRELDGDQIQGLIAKAPELRAALERLADRMEQIELPDGSTPDTLEARALLMEIDGDANA